MESLFKFINKSFNIKNNIELINNAKNIDNLIEKKYNFNDEKRKIYDMNIKYLLKNFTYKLVKDYIKKLKNNNYSNDEILNVYNSKIKSKQFKNKFTEKNLLNRIFWQILFSSHCIVINHTFPVYSPTLYHQDIYNNCNSIDKKIINNESKEFYLFFLFKIFLFIESLNNKVIFKVEQERIKKLYLYNNQLQNINNDKDKILEIKEKLQLLNKKNEMLKELEEKYLKVY